VLGSSSEDFGLQTVLEVKEKGLIIMAGKHSGNAVTLSSSCYPGMTYSSATAVRGMHVTAVDSVTMAVKWSQVMKTTVGLYDYIQMAKMVDQAGITDGDKVAIAATNQINRLGSLILIDTINGA
jgi:predicted ATPase